MKKYIISFMAIILVLSCNTSKNYLKKGQYDLAVKHTVKKLLKNPDKEKEILVLEQAYTLANKENTERIAYLNLQGQPDRWAEIFEIYTQLKDRQTIVEKVTPATVEGRTVSFEHVDYDQLIVDAKSKAAAYYYAHAKKLMEEDYKESYRQAYDELINVKTYTSSYSDVDSLLLVCKEKGTIHALLIGVNNTIYKLPESFMINLLDQETALISSEWVKYHSTKDDAMTYDFNVSIKLNQIVISPDNVGERRRTESKKVQDGYEYSLDENGNVLKDTLGNDIKEPKYVTIYCDVIETIQQKSATGRGEVEYFDNQTSEIVIVRDFSADHIFEHSYAVANGDFDALNSDTRSKLGIKPMPYPSDQDMFNGLGATLKNVISQLLSDNSTNLLMSY